VAVLAAIAAALLAVFLLDGGPPSRARAARGDAPSHAPPTDEGFELRSAGPDGLPGTADDLVRREPAAK
jgi:hypothetical protein